MRFYPRVPSANGRWPQLRGPTETHGPAETHKIFLNLGKCIKIHRLTSWESPAGLFLPWCWSPRFFVFLTRHVQTIHHLCSRTPFSDYRQYRRCTRCAVRFFFLLHRIKLSDSRPQHGALFTRDTSLSRRDDSSNHLERRGKGNNQPILPTHNTPAPQAHDAAIQTPAVQSTTTTRTKPSRQGTGSILPMYNTPASQNHDAATKTPAAAGQSNTPSGGNPSHNLMPKTGQKPHLDDPNIDYNAAENMV